LLPLNRVYTLSWPGLISGILALFLVPALATLSLVVEPKYLDHARTLPTGKHELYWSSFPYFPSLQLAIRRSSVSMMEARKLEEQ
jgi:hypothetical protein